MTRILDWLDRHPQLVVVLVWVALFAALYVADSTVEW